MKNDASRDVLYTYDALNVLSESCFVRIRVRRFLNERVQSCFYPLSFCIEMLLLVLYSLHFAFQDDLLQYPPWPFEFSLVVVGK